MSISNMLTYFNLCYADMLQAIVQWEEAQGAPFEYRGTRYLDSIEQSETAYCALKEELKLAKVRIRIT